MRHIHVQQLVALQFCKDSKKLQTRIIFEHYYSVFHLLPVVLSLRDAPK